MCPKSMPRRSPLTCSMARRTRRRATASGRLAQGLDRNQDARPRVPPGVPADRRPISASQYSSSARAQSAVRARVSAMAGFHSRGELRQQLVADAIAGELAGWRWTNLPARRSRARAGTARPRRGSISIRGRTMPSLVTGRMAASPAPPAPRRKRKSTVSAWSLRVWPRRCDRPRRRTSCSRKKASRASRAACSRLPGAAATSTERIEAGRSQTGGQIADELLVLPGFLAAQSVIEVEDAEVSDPVRARVRAARGGDRPNRRRPRPRRRRGRRAANMRYRWTVPATRARRLWCPEVGLGSFGSSGIAGESGGEGRRDIGCRVDSRIPCRYQTNFRK